MLPKPWDCFESSEKPSDFGACSELDLILCQVLPMHTVYFQRRSEMWSVSYPSEWSLVVNQNRAAIRTFNLTVTPSHYLKYDDRYFASVTDVLWYIYDKGLVDTKLKSAVSLRYGNNNCYIFVGMRRKQVLCQLRSSHDYRKSTGIATDDATTNDSTSQSEASNYESLERVNTDTNMERWAHNAPMSREYPNAREDLNSVESNSVTPPEVQPSVNPDKLFENFAAQVERERLDYESEKRRLTDQLETLEREYTAKRRRTKEAMQRASTEIMEKWARLAATLE